jgi:hypothetical protein
MGTYKVKVVENIDYNALEEAVNEFLESLEFLYIILLCFRSAKITSTSFFLKFDSFIIWNCHNLLFFNILIILLYLLIDGLLFFIKLKGRSLSFSSFHKSIILHFFSSLQPLQIS